MDTNAGVGGHANVFLAAAANYGYLIFQTLGRLLEITDGGQKTLAFGRQPDTVAVADEQRKAHFLLQRVHHMRQTRLGIAQAVCSFGKAAGLYGGEQRLPLFGIHKRLSPNITKSNIYYIISIYLWQ